MLQCYICTMLLFTMLSLYNVIVYNVIVYNVIFLECYLLHIKKMALLWRAKLGTLFRYNRASNCLCNT